MLIMKLIQRIPKEKTVDKIYYPLVGDFYPHKDWLDGGDTAHRTGFMFVLFYFHLSYQKDIAPHYLEDAQSDANAAIRYLECPWAPGIYRRHPHKGYWYSDDDRMSRDQWIPMLAMLSFWDKEALKRAFWAHMKRGMLFMSNTRRNGTTKANHGQKQNQYTDEIFDYSWKMPDPTLFGVWAQYIRGLNMWFLYPLLCILDISLLVNALIIKKTDKSDIFQHIVQCLQAKKQLPTPISWAVNKYLNDSDSFHARNLYYMRDEAHEVGIRLRPQFLADMAKPVMDKEFGNESV